jgi:hypothetical protein
MIRSADLPLQDRLNQDAEAAQCSAEQHSGGGAQQRGHSDRLDVPPRYQMAEEVGREFAAASPKRPPITIPMRAAIVTARKIPFQVTGSTPFQLRSRSGIYFE